MNAACPLPVTTCSTSSTWRDLVWPREHGSWSLAFEPVALGLLAAFSLAGSFLAVAIVAAFFARRPLRAAFTDARRERRIAAVRMTILCGALALSAGVVAIAIAGWSGCLWLIPSVVAAAAFLYFDLHKEGRGQYAEISGAMAFAWLPAVFAIFAGWNAASAAALGAVMLGRAVPTVLTIRAALRARKAGEYPSLWPVAFAGIAALGTVALARNGVVPTLAPAALTLLTVRSFVLLTFPRPALRASTIGIIEAVMGAAFVVSVAIAWSH